MNNRTTPITPESTIVSSSIKSPTGVSLVAIPTRTYLVSVIAAGEWQYACDIPGNCQVQIVARGVQYRHISNDGRPLVEVDVHGWFRQGIPPGAALPGWYAPGYNSYSFLARIRKGSNDNGSDFWLLNRESNSRPHGDSICGESFKYDVGANNGGRLFVGMNDDWFKDNGGQWTVEVRIFQFGAFDLPKTD